MILDRPVWTSLTTVHRDLGTGNELARRYALDVNLWAAARDDSPAALESLSRLAGPGGSIYLAEAEPITVPPGMLVRKKALGVQLVDTGTVSADAETGDIVPLGDADASEMLALATLTEPGPYLARTHVMGSYGGIRIDGRLVAMAGERLHLPGYTEISAVCTHPNFRNRGFGRRLLLHAMATIRARGETPFLHAWKTNAPAIRLYENLGFRYRCDINVAVLDRPGV
ncbi:MAG: GNAT family N-acetyltransferase [Rhodospirillales bacterium]